jgi:DNA-binding CsgD family transcriptional regulator
MPAATLLEPLTLRQLELVVHVANGMTFQEIAEAEMISRATVKNTLTMARERAGARNLPQLVAKCVAAGLIVNLADSN